MLRDCRNKITIREYKSGFQWVVKSSTGSTVCVSKLFEGPNAKRNAQTSMRLFVESATKKGFICDDD